MHSLHAVTLQGTSHTASARPPPSRIVAPGKTSCSISTCQSCTGTAVLSFRPSTHGTRSGFNLLPPSRTGRAFFLLSSNLPFLHSLSDQMCWSLCRLTFRPTPSYMPDMQSADTCMRTIERQAAFMDDIDAFSAVSLGIYGAERSSCVTTILCPLPLTLVLRGLSNGQWTRQPEATQPGFRNNPDRPKDSKRGDQTKICPQWTISNSLLSGTLRICTAATEMQRAESFL